MLCQSHRRITGHHSQKCENSTSYLKIPLLHHFSLCTFPILCWRPHGEATGRYIIFRRIYPHAPPADFFGIPLIPRAAEEVTQTCRLPSERELFIKNMLVPGRGAQALNVRKQCLFWLPHNALITDFSSHFQTVRYPIDYTRYVTQLEFCARGVSPVVRAAAKARYRGAGSRYGVNMRVSVPYYARILVK